MALARLEIILLSLLATQERTGYDVRKWLDRHGPYVGYTAHTSMIYRQFGKLEERGWAVPNPDPRHSGPDAKLYRITEQGIRELKSWISSPYEPPARPLDVDFQVRLRFAAQASPHNALELVRTELAVRKAAHQMRTAFDEEDLPPDADNAERAWMEELGRIQSERGHYMVSNLIAWLEATELRLEAYIRDLGRRPTADSKSLK